MRYFLFIGALCWLLLVVIIKTDDYFVYQIRKCTVIEKFVTSSDRKYNLALKCNGNDFNMTVDVDVYIAALPGKEFFLNLRQYDIKQKWLDDFIYFFGQIFAALGAIVFLTLGIYRINDQTIPNPFRFRNPRFRKGVTRQELKIQFAEAVENEEFELAIKLDRQIKRMSSKNLFKKFLK